MSFGVGIIFDSEKLPLSKEMKEESKPWIYWEKMKFRPCFCFLGRATKPASLGQEENSKESGK